MAAADAAARWEEASAVVAAAGVVGLVVEVVEATVRRATLRGELPGE